MKLMRKEKMEAGLGWVGVGRRGSLHLSKELTFGKQRSKCSLLSAFDSFTFPSLLSIHMKSA